MTAEQIYQRRQFCFQQACIRMQWNGRSNSTNPTMDELMAEAEKLYDWIYGVEI
ncbi:MAG: hypothetical protein ACOYL3_16165 [Desulfuromonadaceae bacterium]